MKFALAGKWISKSSQANKILSRAMRNPDHAYRIAAATSVAQILRNNRL